MQKRNIRNICRNIRTGLNQIELGSVLLDWLQRLATAERPSAEPVCASAELSTLPKTTSLGQLSHYDQGTMLGPPSAGPPRRGAIAFWMIRSSSSGTCGTTS